MSAEPPANQNAISRTNIPDSVDPHHADSVLFEFRELYRGPGNSDEPARHVDPEDLVLYALQFLSGEQSFAFSRHIEQCAECHREFELVQGDLAACAFTIDLQTPSALSRQRLMTQVAREKKVIPVVPPLASASPLEGQSQAAGQMPLAAYGRTGSILSAADGIDEEEYRSKKSPVLTLLGGVGWVLAVGLGVAAGALYRINVAQRNHLSVQSAKLADYDNNAAPARQLMDALTDPDAVHASLASTPQQKPQPVGRATYNATSGSLMFFADNLDPLPANKVYELWLISTDGGSPTPAAVFHPDKRGSGSVILPTLPKDGPVKSFGLSVEDEGGGATPTLPFVLAGASSL
jgi:hypothetical protein